LPTTLPGPQPVTLQRSPMSTLLHTQQWAVRPHT